MDSSRAMKKAGSDAMPVIAIRGSLREKRNTLTSLHGCIHPANPGGEH
jgi:hypothetical protein